MNLYADLGVDEAASAADIKRSFKRRASKSHPDKGGSTEEFQKVQRAYAVLSDESKRKRYDETGQDGDLPDLRVMAQVQLSALFCQLIEKSDPDTTPFIDQLKRICNEGLVMGRQQLRQQEAKIAKLAVAKCRLGRKKVEGPNFLAAALAQQTQQANAQLEGIKQNLALGDEMLKLLADYEYSADAPKPPEQYTSSPLQT